LNNEIKIFPNPAVDWVVLEGKEIKSVEIINILGSNLGFYPLTTLGLQHRLNLSTLSRGIYFLKINMVDERYVTKKIILQY
jgi:hypothetical protein